jgi:uncharacterized protein (TIGR03435 family)
MTNRIAHNGKKLLHLLGLLALSLAATVAAHAQTTTTPAIPTKPITFEVVSIRQQKQPDVRACGPGFTDDGYIMHCARAFNLLFSISNGLRLEGIPPDLQKPDAVYDIQAKLSEADIPAWKKLSRLQRIPTLQALLEDHFKLKFHRETRTFKGYALVIAKGGIKFKEATPDDKYEKGFKALGGEPLTGVMMGISRGVTSGQAITMDKVAEFLGLFAGSPVLDKTGLTGKYDLTLKVDLTGPRPPVADGQASDPTGEVSIFTAVQEQLGLKLESGATVPVGYFVVDHFERPAEN